MLPLPLTRCGLARLLLHGNTPQHWAAQARQGKFLVGRSDDSPLSKCVQYLGTNAPPEAGVGVGSVKDSRVGNLCAGALVALSEIGESRVGSVSPLLR